MRLGGHGPLVSRICLGAMSYGDPHRGAHPRTLDEASSRQYFKQALDVGITFFDTANVYSDGTSEEITGRALWSLTPREDVVLATKVGEPMGNGPQDSGLSRDAILAQADASLRRLGTDYIDLYIIHRLDPVTAMQETLDALDTLLRAGKVRYLGASSMYAWQFAKAIHVAERLGVERFVSMQNHWNLLYREEEREMVPLCPDAGIGLTPSSPLAKGPLARDRTKLSERSSKDLTAKRRYQVDTANEIVDAVGAVAQNRGIPRAQVALAWLLSNPGVVAPVVGATKPHHLTDLVESVHVTLTADEIALLSEPYRPQPVQGH